MKLDDLILSNYKVSDDRNNLMNCTLRKVYIETYGCQMNFSDTEIILSILLNSGYKESYDINNSEIILLNTCSVREHAESRIYSRLESLRKFKKSNPDVIIGILGCMAERLKDTLIKKEKIVDLIVGPDEYRSLPLLIESVIRNNKKGIAVDLSNEETYQDIIPYRRKGITAWVSIMRGCDKFCSYCVVPYTRGRERSRSYISIIEEIAILKDIGIKDICLLGQNVNSYKYDKYDFADLLKECALNAAGIRIRFITSHPYDLSIKLLETMAEHENICKYLHLPVQSGSNRILKLMNRFYTVEKYIDIIKLARKLIPDIGFSTDIICGFPTETEEDHKSTMNLLEQVRYDSAYTFIYSPRENTKAYEYSDDVIPEIKKRRIEKIINLQRKISYEINNSLIGKVKSVLAESVSKKSDAFLMGKTDCNKTVIFPKTASGTDSKNKKSNRVSVGDFVNVKIKKVNSATLFGEQI